MLSRCPPFVYADNLCICSGYSDYFRLAVSSREDRSSTLPRRVFSYEGYDFFHCDLPCRGLLHIYLHSFEIKTYRNPFFDNPYNSAYTPLPSSLILPEYIICTILSSFIRYFLLALNESDLVILLGSFSVSNFFFAADTSEIFFSNSSG